MKNISGWNLRELNRDQDDEEDSAPSTYPIWLSPVDDQRRNRWPGSQLHETWTLLLPSLPLPLSPSFSSTPIVPPWCCLISLELRFTVKSRVSLMIKVCLSGRRVWISLFVELNVGDQGEFTDYTCDNRRLSCQVFITDRKSVV